MLFLYRKICYTILIKLKVGIVMIIDSSLLSDASKGFQSYFDRLKSETDNLIKQIYFFVNDSYLKDKLKGEGWNTVRKYMHSYISILEKLKVVCDTLSNNIVSANNSVIVAMEGFSIINLNQKEELISQKNKLKAGINEARQYLYIEYETEDDKGDTIYETRIDGYWQNIINEYSLIIKEIENKLVIIEKTKIAYDKAKDIMSGDLSSVVSNYTSKITNVIGK